MSVDRREYPTPATGAAPRERGPIRALALAIVVLEAVRIALLVLQLAVRPSGRIDPTTGFFVSTDPLSSVRALLPYVDVVLYVGVVLLLCVVLTRLAQSTGVAVGLTFAAAGVVLFFGLASIFVLHGTKWLSLVPLLALPAAALDGVTSFVAALAAMLTFVVLGIVLGARRSSAAPLTAAGYAPGPAPYAGVAPSEAGRRIAGYDPPLRTNGLAIASLIVVFFSSLIGLILGHVALAQIRRTGEGGHGLALAAVIIGWVSTAISLIALTVVFVTVFLHPGSTY